jgi:16S rRNA (adenine1518-N6/adenine1519-N6)-dimethyltransferase
VRPKKRFGQHFLEPAWVERVIQIIDPRPEDVFIEIGPGRGAITFPLADRARHVYAFEIDRGLAAALRGARPNLTVIDGDFLELVPSFLFPVPSDESLRVAGNLPYNVASPILLRLLDLYARGLRLTDATLMLQREVAVRLTASPGSRDYGVLSVLVQHRADVSRALSLPPGAFRPPPKVRSTLVSVRFRAAEPVPQDDRVFKALVQAIFTRRRKTLANALLAFGGTSRLDPRTALERASLDGRRRPETLSIAELVRLGDAYAGQT